MGTGCKEGMFYVLAGRTGFRGEGVEFEEIGILLLDLFLFSSLPGQQIEPITPIIEII